MVRTAWVGSRVVLACVAIESVALKAGAILIVANKSYSGQPDGLAASTGHHLVHIR
jgi:exosortase/archaeosortase